MTGESSTVGDSESTGGTLGRIRTATTIGSREFLRDPVLVGLLVVLPVYFVGVWGLVVPADPILVEVRDASGPTTVGADFPGLMTALVAPVTGALLVGITGLFLVQRSRAVDARLHVVGYRAPELLASRFGLLALVTVFVVTVTFAISHLHVTPEHPGWFAVGLLLGAMTYGVVGTIAGLFLGRMAGVYLLLFAPMLDMLLLQMPIADSPWWADWLPGHHAVELTLSATFAGTVATEHAIWAVGVVVVLGAFALLLSIPR